MRRGRRKQTPQATGRYLVDPETWFLMVTAGGCEMHDDPAECEGLVQGCHVIPRMTLRRYGHADRLWDVRNGLGACYKAHRRSDAGLERFPVDRLPAAVWDFADELGLTWKLVALYGERAA